MNLTKMIYLASPYTSKDSKNMKERLKKEEERYRDITAIAAQLEEEYPYAFILPITMSHNTAKYMEKKNGEFEYWATRDYTYISKSDEVWVIKMEGWDKSVGVMNEIKFAEEHNIPVIYIENLLNKYLNLDDSNCIDINDAVKKYKNSQYSQAEDK